MGWLNESPRFWHNCAMPPDFPSSAAASDTPIDDRASPAAASDAAPPEEGGPEGPEPTRFGDWERKGRCIDF